MKPIQTLLKNRLIYFSLIILIAFFLPSINVENLWYDEIASFWVSDPSLSYIETYSRVLNENTPSAYYFLIKLFFSFFSYDPDFLRIFTLANIYNIINLL